MVQLDYPGDRKAGNRMKKQKLPCYTKHFGTRGGRKRPEFNNSHKLFVVYLDVT